MKIKTTCLPFFDDIEIKEATFQQKTFPTHHHDTYSIGIIAQGNEKITLAGKNIMAHANSVIVINPYEPHANAYIDNDAWAYKCLYVGLDTLRFVSQDKTCLPYFPTQLIDDAYLSASLLQFFAGRQDSQSVTNLLCHLLENYTLQKPENELNSLQNEQMQAAQHYISQQTQSTFNLDTIAQKYHISKFQFIRNFKKYTGLTPVSYLLMHRINQAKKLIREGIPLTKAGLEVGFYDQAHFIKYFQKYIGISPMQYKKGCC